MDKSVMKKLVAEMIGTFVLVFGGVGTAVLAGSWVGALGVALAFGFTLLVMAYAIGPISGCHINPAVTLGMFMSKKIGGKEALFYMVAQVIGAILAAGILFIVASGGPGFDAAASGFGSNGYGDHSPGGFELGAVMIIEVVLTALLMLTVLFTTDKKAAAGFAGIPIGIVLALIHLISIPVDNTSVNPARSIGPALFQGGWAIEQLWIFIAAPMVGAALAAIIYDLLKD
ncbi:MAG TPA: aquaporin Z [Methanomassiliicoccales archaeon]|nr:aquaporin Z [Methanomassiliicoccales archaeon]HNX47596.1 aquaporin Z [Methanomassiliicoccales archaeon]HPR98414.1 aquaporin Z [Methanomassiliicoccales archaeon]